jgi:response regulator RpfG family c-di-GMP phosphodiesterase
MNISINEMKKEFNGHILLHKLENPVAKCLSNDFLESNINVLKSDSQEEALEFLKTGVIDVVLTNYSSNGDGTIELLNMVREKYPMTNRALLCYGEEQREVKNLLSKGVANNYFEKPRGFGSILESILDTISTNTQKNGEK